MKRSLLLSAAAAVCLALPAVSLADPPSDHGKKKDQQSQQQHQGESGQGGAQGHGQQGQGGQTGQGGQQGTGGGSTAHRSSAGAGSSTGGSGNAGAAAQHESSGASGVQTQQGQVRSGQFQAHQGQQAAHAAQSTEAAAAAHRTTTTVPNVQAQQFQKHADQPQSQTFQAARRPPTPPPLANWNRTARGADRDRAGQQWRQGHQGWDRTAVWRQDPNWWRQDSGFRLYLGPRVGYFFIPGWGYLSVPVQYRNHYWRPGEYLPRWFRLHVVHDYHRYGLPRPPYGCTWIWLQGEVALVDTSDGYILDLVRNAW